MANLPNTRKRMNYECWTDERRDSTHLSSCPRFPSNRLTADPLGSPDKFRCNTCVMKYVRICQLLNGRSCHTFSQGLYFLVITSLESFPNRYTIRRRPAPIAYHSSLWTASAYKSRFSSHSQFCAAYIPAVLLIRLWRCLSCACEEFGLPTIYWRLASPPVWPPGSGGSANGAACVVLDAGLGRGSDEHGRRHGRW
ncbi:hypothetical protein H4582DRAFT_2132674 [Lactarius indigo]|nr:hypothetical protein H4582DRAFT_2132674 [Lactarius indigo]